MENYLFIQVQSITEKLMNYNDNEMLLQETYLTCSKFNNINQIHVLTNLHNIILVYYMFIKRHEQVFHWYMYSVFTLLNGLHNLCRDIPNQTQRCCKLHHQHPSPTSWTEGTTSVEKAPQHSLKLGLFQR